ncbi:MAG: hypothetical protein J5667_02290 [Bacteroidales bacterium]|nr:hypothetical protein [Bacteroidales bacterium]
MMKTRHIILSALLALIACGVSMAQTINPSVEVTNDFLSSVDDYNKVVVDPAVPDSVVQFNLNFDYDVFAKPYKGSYDFTPYNIMFIPQTTREKRSVFFMNLGAGYTLHPVATAVLSPRTKGKFAITAYQDFQGYYGPYRHFDNTIRWDGTSTYDGMDLSERAGIQGTLRLAKTDLMFNVAYNGLFVRDEIITAGTYHDFGGQIRIASADWADNFMAYDVEARYNMAVENAVAALKESKFVIRGTLAPVSEAPVGFAMDFNTGYTGYYGALSSAIYNIATTPKVDFDLWKFHFSTGAKFSFINRMANNQFYVYPHLKIDIKMVGDKLDLFAGVTGGDELNSYSRLKRRNHHFHYDAAEAYDDLRFSREKYNAFVGLTGSISSLFEYDLRFGHAALENSPLDGINAAANSAVVKFADYDMTYGDFTAVLDLRSLEFETGLHYRKTDIAGLADVFDLPMFSSDFSLTYNLRRRIYLGASLDMALARKMTSSAATPVTYTLPAWYDLGLYGEYKFGQVLSLWVRGGNLLNQTIEKVPFIAEHGVHVTAGLCLNFR